MRRAFLLLEAKNCLGIYRLSDEAFSKVRAVVKNRNDSYLQIVIITIKYPLK